MNKNVPELTMAPKHSIWLVEKIQIGCFAAGLLRRAPAVAEESQGRLETI